MPRDDRNLQWVDLTDFRPGIYTRSDRALGKSAVPAPLGAAQYMNTYRCCALPSGGLAPGPLLVSTIAGPTPEASYVHGPWCVGGFAFGPVIVAGGSTFPDELFVGVDYIFNNAGNNQRRFRLYRLKVFASPQTNDTLVSIDTATANPIDQYWGMTFGASRINPAAPTNPGYPVVVTEWSEPGPGTEQHVWTFPDPSAPNVSGVLSLSTTAGQILTHQGRVVLLADLSYVHGAGGAVPTNEQIYFTDPPNSAAMGAQGEVFMQEYPNGYGAWGSISAGELFLIKNQGGGVVIAGDIANPSITRLPGVVSTGELGCRAASSPHGLFYATNEGGIYSWRGGDTSVDVSPQLDPNAFPNNPKGSSPDTDATTLLNIQCSLEAWQNWVLVSNNWLYDTTTGGWWQIEDATKHNIRWWSRGSHSNLMYGAPLAYDPAGAFFAWDKSRPTTSYSWQSHPIPASVNRLTEVRDMVLVAQGAGTVTVTLTAFDGATQAETFTVTNTSQPQRLRPAVGGTFAKGYNVVVRIVSDGGSGAAPVVHSLHLGCRDAQPAVAA